MRHHNKAGENVVIDNPTCAIVIIDASCQSINAFNFKLTRNKHADYLSNSKWPINGRGLY